MNGILVLNKPADYTSMDCCAIIRKLSNQKKVGHTGTLDPNATGVLPIFIGKATRLIEYCDGADKSYIASCKLGITTNTQDIWGEVIGTVDPGRVTIEKIQAVLQSFSGRIQQIPPMFSAIKIKGRKLYEYARSGEEIVLNPRNVTIHSIKLISYNEAEGEFIFEADCSKGTYIRTICHDIGKKIGCGAVMTSLVRTRAGSFSLDMACSFSDIEEKGLENLILSPEYAVDFSRKIIINEYIRDVFVNGNPRWIRLAAKHMDSNAELLKYNGCEPVPVVCNNRLVGMLRNGTTEKVFRGLYDEDF